MRIIIADLSKTKGMRLFLASLLLSFVDLSRQYVGIELKNNSKSVGDQYTDNSFFTYHYTNFPKSGKISGYVWRWNEYPNDGCEYITPLTASVLLNSSKWFALVEDITACEDEMIEHVRNAGFHLIVGYTNSSSPSNIPKSLRESEFPIVTISGDYANTLWTSAANSVSEALEAEVTVYDYDALLVGLCTGFLMFALVFAILFCCICYLKCRSRRGSYTIANNHRHDPLHQRYAQARLARQELIESILRQLQELQIEERQHTPLGEAATRALPCKTFAQARGETSGKETCAICVEEFKDKDITRVLPCNHFFHPDCIDPWLIDHSSMCPLCKQSVSGDDEVDRLSIITTEDSDSSVEIFSTPVLALADITSSTSPLARNLSTNADDSSSASSDIPLLRDVPRVNV